ncbi:MAG TPA: hypothetical protein VGC86_15935 [Afipia sp.]
MMQQAATTRSEAEAAVILDAFEQRHDAFGFVVDGISIWRILRFEISLALQNLDLSRSAISRPGMLGTLIAAAWQLAFPVRGIRYLGKTSNSGLRTRDERGFLDVYFDHMIDGISGGAKMSSLDAGGFTRAEKEAARAPVFDDTPVFLVSALTARLFPSRTHAEVFDALSSLIRRDLGLHDFTAARVRRKYDVLKIRARLYEQVLRRFGARTVMVPNSGQFALFLATRACGISFVEMQHGLFSEFHPDNLPAWVLAADKDSLLLPDYLTVYGPYWAERLAGTALGKIGRIRSVGAPLVEINRDLRAARFASNPQIPVLIFTLQGLGVEYTIDFIKKFLALSDRPMRFIVKLHPGYDSGDARFRDLFGADRRVEIIAGDAQPDTYQMIAMADLHLSISSACHYEALGIGTPTCVVAGPSHAQVLDLVTRGDALLVRDAAELHALVDARGWGEVPSSTQEVYFSGGFVPNMASLLNECERGPEHSPS